MLVKINTQKLIEKREKAGLSRNQLSAKAGLSNNAVFRMECKEYRVSDLRAKTVADVLGCRLNEIVLREV